MISFGRCSFASRSTSSMSMQVRLRAHLVGGDVVELARDVELHPVREVAAVREREAHDPVARIQQGQEHLGVRGRAGVRLDVRVLGAEELLGAVDRELLDDVDVLAAAVVALSRVALGVLVREHAALALEDGARDEVLRGDHLERALLAIELEADGLGDLRVDVGERAVEEVRRQIGHRAPMVSPRAGPSPVRDQGSIAPIWSTRRGGARPRGAVEERRDDRVARPPARAARPTA